MKLALAQMLVEGGRPGENLKRAGERIEAASRRGADIVLLPEALDFGWNHPSAREGAGPVPGGKSFQVLAREARQNGVFVCAGLIEGEGEHLYNAAVLLDPAGALRAHHRKVNELEIARDLYEVGRDACAIAGTEFGKLGLEVCADGFAEGQWISRRLCEQGVEIILSPCAWAVPPEFDPQQETYGWIWRENYEPVAREYGVWIAGCSNVGWIEAGSWNGHKCIGNSIVFDGEGREVLTGPCGEAADEILMVEIPDGPRCRW